MSAGVRLVFRRANMMTRSVLLGRCGWLVALLGVFGCATDEPTNKGPESKSDKPPTIAVNPQKLELEVGQTGYLDLVVTVPDQLPTGLGVASDLPGVVPQPSVDDFTQKLPEMKQDYTFEPTGGPDAARVAVQCQFEGVANLTFSVVDVNADVYGDSAEITCKPKDALLQATRCLVPFANETLMAVDEQGKLQDTTSWGKGAASAGAAIGSGANTQVAMVGYNGNQEPTLWLSGAFDPAVQAPSSWDEHALSGESGAFGSIAPRGNGFVVTSVAGVYLYQDGSFTPGTAPDVPGAVACDDAGMCIGTGSSSGGVLRTSDGLDWSSNGGSERFSPIKYCNGVFVVEDIFQGKQLWSDDGGMTWTPGDLDAFNVYGFDCDATKWVATAQTGTYYSEDGGKTWTKVDATLGKLSYSPSGSAFFAIGGGTGFPSIWTSSDALTWTQTADLGMNGAMNDVICF